VSRSGADAHCEAADHLSRDVSVDVDGDGDVNEDVAHRSPRKRLTVHDHDHDHDHHVGGAVNRDGRVVHPARRHKRSSRRPAGVP
jgi:hypothetical protein